MRLRTALVALVACVGALALAGPALAEEIAPLPPFDSQTTNQPYLAWRGEEVRLVLCEPSLEGEPWPTEGTSEPDGSDGVDATWTIETWTGHPFQRPVPMPDTVRFFVDDNEESEHYTDNCVRANFVSQRAGLAAVSLVVTNPAEDVVATHQFLVGWLQLNPPKLESDTSQSIAAGVDMPTKLVAHVTGSLPLLDYDNESVSAAPAFQGLPLHIQLPAEDDGSTYWDELARTLATTSDARPIYRDSPWLMWDVHDDSAASEGNVPGECESAVFSAVDAVDNCLGGPSDEGPFSRIWGDVTDGFATYGPFDPLRPSETFLGDGKLDAGDVPMPAARLDFEILDDVTDPIDSVGYLAEYDKSDEYAREWASDDVPHNAYAPFYVSHIPAARAEFDDHAGVASGTDITGDSEISPTYLTCAATVSQEGMKDSCAYPFWRFEAVLRTVQAQDTACVRRYDAGAPVYYQTPAGEQAAVVYTDEHGEAMAKYVAGTGFYFDDVLRLNHIEVTPSTGCDIERVGPLGTVRIHAIARYPGRDVLEDPDKPSNVISKRIENLSDREIRCTRTGPGTIDPVSWICSVLAVDIDGYTAESEKVCFTTDGEGVAVYPATKPYTQEGPRLCQVTEFGEARIEIFGRCKIATIPTTVVADFTDVRLTRSAKIAHTCPSTGGGGGDGSTGPDDPEGTTPEVSSPPAPGNPAPSVPPASVTPVPPAPGSGSTPPPASAKVALVRIQAASSGGGRYVVVRVNGSATSARIELRLIKKNGRTLRRVLRVVRTNRVVRVPELKLDKIVTKVAVGIVGATGGSTASNGSTGSGGAAAGAKVILVRIDVASTGERGRYVVVRVNSPKSTAKIELRLVKENGRTLRRVSRVVPTNRIVRVPDLKLDSVVTSVQARILA